MCTAFCTCFFLGRGSEVSLIRFSEAAVPQMNRRTPAPVSSVGLWQGLGRPLPRPVTHFPPGSRLVAQKVLTPIAWPQSAQMPRL